ncbi:MAG: VWA domain-containing protein [Polyangiaceae bacterium]
MMKPLLKVPYRRALGAFASGLLLFGLCGACSGTGETELGVGGSMVQIGQGGSGSVNGNGGGNSSVGFGGSSSSSGSTSNGCGLPTDEVCGGADFEVESMPLDIYVMFDQSGSMLNDVGGLTRMAAVQQAVGSFLHDPESVGIGVGIGYFGIQPIGQVSCDANVYANPDVQVSLNHDSVINSLQKRMPTGETPTSAALSGACTYAQDYKSKTPGHTVVILLVTDGKPEAPVSCSTGGCCPTLDEATKQAKACLTGKQQIPTYVLGVGPNLDNLHAIAQAGGTKNAYLVGDQNVTANVLAALNSIRRTAQLPCEFPMPSAQSGAIDTSQVRVLFSQGGCQYKNIYYVSQQSACPSDGGWFFDNPNTPQSIKLCPQSCDLVSNTASSLKLQVGCARIDAPIR